MKNSSDINLENSVKIIICPNDNGFSCAIDCENIKGLKPEQEELIMTIARGLIYQAQKDPNSTFLMGMKGFKKDKSNKKIQTSFKQKINKEDKNKKIIDFIDYLRKKNQHCK